MRDGLTPGHTVYLSLGSNLGNRHALLEQAIDLLEQRVGRLSACSSLLETEPWGFESDHMFLNAAVRLQTTLSPFEVLLATQQMEREMGRTEKSTPINSIPSNNEEGTTIPAQYHDRCIDIDILLYDNLQLDGTYVIDGKQLGLTIPHPLMHQRDFVMIPLREIRW